MISSRMRRASVGHLSELTEVDRSSRPGCGSRAKTIRIDREELGGLGAPAPRRWKDQRPLRDWAVLAVLSMCLVGASIVAVHEHRRARRFELALESARRRPPTVFQTSAEPPLSPDAQLSYGHVARPLAVDTRVVHALLTNDYAKAELQLVELSERFPSQMGYQDAITAVRWKARCAARLAENPNACD